MKKIIAALLILSTLLLSACATKSQNDTQVSDTSEAIKGAYLNGKDISEYTIVYDESGTDYAKRAAKYIQSEISERTGHSLTVTTDEDTPKTAEIVVGETSRAISEKLDKKTEGTDFALLADSGSIALEGEYFVIAAAAYFFVETYITGTDFRSDVPSEATVFEPIVEKANNHIVLIGDGMGLYQTKLFDVYDINALSQNYSDGEDVFYGYMLPYMSFSRTDSLSGTTDSAAGGTALSTGYKTNNGYVGQNKKQKTVTSLTELAAQLGKATAVMSTDASTGATPASFSAHVNNRDKSEEILKDQEELKQNCGTIIECGYDLYDNDGVREIQEKVTSTLDTLSKNDKGFFMMYEEAHIDKHCHSNDMRQTFRALVRFNQVIGIVMEYAFYNPDTFVLITADHETGKLLPDNNGNFAYGSGDHSSADVPVFVYGDGAKLFNDLTIENTQIPKTIANFWGVSDFGDKNDGFKALK